MTKAKFTQPTGGAAMASGKPGTYGKLDTSARAQMLAYIVANPGMRARELPPLFDQETKSRSGTLRSLRASGHVRSTGCASGTKYYATKKQIKTA